MSMRFLTNFTKFLKKITIEDFKKFYLKITGTVSDNAILPSELILIKHFDFIQNEIPKRRFGKNSLNLVVAPRETYKSLTFSRILPLMAIFNSLKTNDDLSLVMVGSYREIDSKTRLFDYLRRFLKSIPDISFVIDNSDLIQIYYKKNNKELQIKTFHSKKSLRGENFNGKRPQLIIMDDIDVPYEMKGNIKEREQLLFRFKNDWLPAIEKENTMIVVIGIPEGPDSIVAYLLQQPTVNILKLPYKIDEKYLRKDWDEEWEKSMRIMMGEDFKRQYELEIPFYKDFEFEIDLDELKKDVIGLLDMGINENNTALVILKDNIIIDILYLKFDIKVLVDKIYEYGIRRLYVESNTWQSLVINNLLKKSLQGIDIIPMYWNVSKKERALFAWDLIEKKNLRPSLKVRDILLKEKKKLEDGDNPHALDILGTYMYLFNNQKSKIRVWC
ncbi:MAG: hypothetical protein ACPL1F_00145 [bacterium]